MTRITVEGYVIVSADGMLAESDGGLPEALRFEADQAFVARALSRVDLVVRGRHSTDEFPGRVQRRQIVVTGRVAATTTDPDATLWNPAGAPFEAACAEAGFDGGIVAVLGGPEVYALFLDRFDVFFLSQASRVRLPGGKGCFPGVPARTPQQILAAHGLIADPPEDLDAARGVSVTAWRRR